MDEERDTPRLTLDEGALLAAETAADAPFGKPVALYPNLYLVRLDRKSVV